MAAPCTSACSLEEPTAEVVMSHLERFKESFLFAAAKGGKTEEVEALLELGADVNWHSLDGDTPLLAATRQLHENAALLLLQKGANPRARSPRSGGSALHLAVKGGSEALAATLIQNMPEIVHIRDDEGMTAFQRGTGLGKASLVNRLQLFCRTNFRTFPEPSSLIGDSTASCVGDATSSHPPPDLPKTRFPAIHGQERRKSTSSESSDFEGASEESPPPTDYATKQYIRLWDEFLQAEDEISALREDRNLWKTRALAAEAEARLEKTLRSDDLAKNPMNCKLEVLTAQSLDELERALEKRLVVVREAKMAATCRKALEESQINSEQQRLCVVCQEQERNVLLLPCRHLCLCTDCREQLPECCPLCRQGVESYLNVFAS